MTSAEPTTPREPPRLLLPEPRRRPAGFWISLALHVAIVALLWLRRDALVATPLPGDPRFGAAGGGGGGGGGGGARVTTYIIALPPVSPPPAVPTTVPPVVIPPKQDVPVARPTPVPTPVAADTHVVAITSSDTGAGANAGAGTGAGSGGGTGGGQGGGNGTGTGVGSGAGSGGEGGTIRPAELRGLIPPLGFRPPKELRGQSIKVLFSVAADGHVVRFDTEPPITDQDYYKKFSETMLGFRFRPARTMTGEAVASVSSIEFTLPN
jgi:hypothetical protein